MQHLDEGTIHSWLDGALSPEEAARVAAHVAECPQCAAAVAEARGFIAASSRILTALDSAPRGVIPVAAPIRHRNWPMWRAAAAVLVVAGGSLVVIRNTGRESPVPAPAYDSASSNAITSRALVIGESMRTTSEPAAPVKIQGSLSQRTAAGSAQTNVRVPGTRVGKVAAADAMTANSQAAAASPPVAKREDADAAFQAKVPVAQGAAVSGNVAGVENLPTPSLSAAPATPSPAVPTAQPSGMIQLRGASLPSVALDTGVLKVVGRPRRIGARVTLYEVAPGDTVTLTEPLDLQLGAVVVTGIATADPMAKQSAPKRPDVTEEREVRSAAMADSQRRAANAIARARAVSFPAPVRAVETADGVTTISWMDATTGSELKLSGRLPAARLQQIKIRIELERAAAAAAARKTP